MMAESEVEDAFGFSGDSESTDEEERPQEDRKGIKIRVDEYVTASKLGRLAFVAGDVQLAKDRFNLAMNLEFLTEMESASDFGVTGGMLREELSTRTEAVTDVASINDEKLAKVLTKLKTMFVKADEKAALNTADTQSFLVMGATLGMIGEWEKAEAVYKEGVAASPTENQQLKQALQRLNKLRDTIKLVGFENTVKSKKSKTPTLPRSRKSKRPDSLHFTTMDDSKLSRSSSFTSDLSSCGDGDMKETPPLSPLVGGLYSPQVKRKRGFQRIFSKDKWRPKSTLFGSNNNNGNHGGIFPSSSAEDIRGLGIWRERNTWKSVFDFDNVKQSIEQFNSRTVQTMRAMNHCTSLKDHQQSIVNNFKW